jgi:hypothetical protein
MILERCTDAIFELLTLQFQIKLQFSSFKINLRSLNYGISYKDILYSTESCRDIWLPILWNAHCMISVISYRGSEP